MATQLFSDRQYLGFGAGVLLFLQLLVGFATAEESESSFVTQVLSFWGIDATPSTLRGPAEEATGKLWIADLSAGGRFSVTGKGGFRSPLFLFGDTKILALKGEEVVAIAATGGSQTKLARVSGVVKLVATHKSDPNRVMLLLRTQEGVKAGILHLDTRRVLVLDHEGDPKGGEFLAHMKSNERGYGNQELFVVRDAGKYKGEPVEWMDIYFQAQGGEPRNVSRCKPASCSQPSLSHDQRRVVYVKSAG